MKRPHAVHICLFFFNDTATTGIYTLSLRDALPISRDHGAARDRARGRGRRGGGRGARGGWPDARRRPRRPGERVRPAGDRSEEHTSELQSRQYLVCRLLLEKKNTPLTS